MDENNPFDHLEPGDWVPRLILIAFFAAVAVGVGYFVYRPNVARYPTWYTAVARGLGGPELLPGWVPTSSRDIVHAWHVTRLRDDHWFVFRAPAEAVLLPLTARRISIAHARAAGSIPPAALREWPPALRGPADTTGLLAFRDLPAFRCLAVAAPPAADSLATYYIWTCARP